ncbi:MAG: hypothetical protein J6S50_02490 [Oscillospiraceae bacterium]|nr:hypothetical protein [Oscillospiraceae bacterium]
MNLTIPVKTEGNTVAKDSDAKKRWDKENTYKVTIKFQKKTDSDILDYLAKNERADFTKQSIIKRAMRLLMEQEGFVYVPSADTEEDETE